MPTSGSTDYSLTARDVITYALKLIREIDATATASGSDAKDGLVALNLMLKGWQMTGPDVFRNTIGTVSLVGGQASYSLPTNVHAVMEARYRSAAGIDLPMIELGREEYLELPLKSSAGIPTQYYVDGQRAGKVLYLWPVLAAATTETVQYTFQRKFEDVDTLNEEIDVKQEHLEAVVYNLADRLLDIYGKDQPRITQRAMMLKQVAMDSERPGFHTFVPDYR